MIKKLLNESTIQLQVKAENWEEAGIKAGELLLKTNSIKEDYIKRMLEAVYEFGPYIVIAPGIALFHARPESSVNEICISMITLSEPVNFEAGDRDPVDLIFALGAVDHDSHLNLMADLMKILQDNDLLNEIRKAKSKEEVLNMIYKKLA